MARAICQSRGRGSPYGRASTLLVLVFVKILTATNAYAASDSDEYWTEAIGAYEPLRKHAALFDTTSGRQKVGCMRVYTHSETSGRTNRKAISPQLDARHSSAKLGLQVGKMNGSTRTS